MEPEMERTPPVLWLTIQKKKCQQLDSYSQVVQWVIAWKSGTWIYGYLKTDVDVALAAENIMTTK